MTKTHNALHYLLTLFTSFRCDVKTKQHNTYQLHCNFSSLMEPDRKPALRNLRTLFAKGGTCCGKNFISKCLEQNQVPRMHKQAVPKRMLYKQSPARPAACNYILCREFSVLCKSYQECGYKKYYKSSTEKQKSSLRSTYSQSNSIDKNHLPSK